MNIQTQKLLILLIGVISLGSCESAKDKAIDRINALEENIIIDSASFKFDPEFTSAAIAAYDDFVNEFADDTLLAPEYLYKAANLCRMLNQYNKAIQRWIKIYEQYPDHSKAPHSLFLAGFVYENDMRRYDLAKRSYQLFLKKYPDHELVPSVKFSLKFMGKPPEDIIKEFEQNNPQAVDTLAS